jgi:cholesterol transport system auxiliary component
VSILRTTLRSLTIAVAAVALTGCISLFPKAKPAGLYRFGHVAAESSRPATTRASGSSRPRRSSPARP